MPVFFLTVAGFLAGELAQAFRRRRGSTPVNVGAEVVFRLVFVGGALLLALGRARFPGAAIGGGVWTFGLGAVLGWLGLLLRWWSFRTLGRYFTVVLTTSADQPVVRTGPYRFLRHPSYSGLLLVVAGLGLMLQNWVGLAGAFGLLLVALVWRIRVEERALVAAVGDRYREFAGGRARLIPHVW
jgi:protein-S-isoprenylcysteine O-methyltransferase Ste14